MAEQAVVQSLPLARAGAILKKRAGLWPLLTAITLLVVIAGVLGNHVLSDRYGVMGTATAYMDALNRGDSETAFSFMRVMDPSPLTPTDVRLLDAKALRAQLAIPANRPAAGWRTSQVQEGSVGGSAVTSNGATSTKLILYQDGTHHFGIYPSWRVMVEPAVLQITAPVGGPQVAVDGVALPSQARMVAVLPGRHQVTSSASSLFDATSTSVDADTSTPGKAIPVAMQLRLSTAGQQAAGTAIKNAIGSCGASGWSLSDACPHFTGMPLANKFELIGDPTDQATFAMDGSGHLVAAGHLQMIATVEDLLGPPYHRLVAGSYTAQLAGSDGNLHVLGFGQPSGQGVPFAKPSGITDDALISAVAKAFTACAAATTVMPSDCPNQYPTLVGQQSNVRWSFRGSPTSDATLSFDPNTGVFQVTGTYAATVQFHQTILVSASDETHSVSGKYAASIVIDKGAPRLVTIQAMQ